MNFVFDEGAAVLDINGVKLIKFKSLMKYDKKITHCFSTRIGGVSTGECSSLNLGLNRNDKRENVAENFRRISRALMVDDRNMVLSNQVHGDGICVVSEKDRGKGLHRNSDITHCDALITNRSEVVLVTFHADCVPVFFYDKLLNVIALVHSGWRGTASDISGKTVRKMAEEFGSSPEDIIAVIGPSINKCCFEVDRDVYMHFNDYMKQSKDLYEEKPGNKWCIDLQGIIKRQLVLKGIPEENISISRVCTKCNTDIFFSHRGENGRTGSLAAFLQLNSDLGE